MENISMTISKWKELFLKDSIFFFLSVMPSFYRWNCGDSANSSGGWQVLEKRIQRKDESELWAVRLLCGTPLVETSL